MQDQKSLHLGAPTDRRTIGGQTRQRVRRCLPAAACVVAATCLALAASTISMAATAYDAERLVGNAVVANSAYPWLAMETTCSEVSLVDFNCQFFRTDDHRTISGSGSLSVDSRAKSASYNFNVVTKCTGDACYYPGADPAYIDGVQSAWVGVVNGKRRCRSVRLRRGLRLKVAVEHGYPAVGCAKARSIVKRAYKHRSRSGFWSVGNWTCEGGDGNAFSCVGGNYRLVLSGDY